MKIPITIPDDCVEEVEAYCQKHSNMSFQARVQQEADKIVNNILPIVKLRKGLKIDLDEFFDAFKEIINIYQSGR